MTRHVFSSICDKYFGLDRNVPKNSASKEELHYYDPDVSDTVKKI